VFEFVAISNEAAFSCAYSTLAKSRHRAAGRASNEGHAISRWLSGAATYAATHCVAYHALRDQDYGGARCGHQPGQSGNPKDRPKGSRNKLTEDFFGDLCDAWQAFGKPALLLALSGHSNERIQRRFRG